ncbi:hypothetical protein L1987_79373 [Smallanthus sonchifolius]|uniref:Uncharacterized protein n=1 Tax=Smallanthus sonchifolius TaxID=185202 RepID=A0ACB8ZEG6_9ASTR|nr:hypothetical protein L1987_79373 [Smallanthus sonchifolius]
MEEPEEMMEEPEEGEIVGGEKWKDVVNKRNRRRPPQIQRNRRIIPGTITFFVSNLPNDVSEKGLTETFSNKGRVVDVYVATKRDSLGNIFAFVRFSGVKNVLALEQSLKEVKLGYSKLFVRLAKFEVGGKKVNQVSMAKETQKVGNKSCSGKLPAVTVEAEKTVMAKLVGNGGMHVLLSFTDRKSALEFLNTQRNVWKNWFSKLEVWEEQLVIFQRIAWIRVYGVPVQLWDKETLNAVGSRCWVVEEEGNWVPDFLGGKQEESGPDQEPKEGPPESEVGKSTEMEVDQQTQPEIVEETQKKEGERYSVKKEVREKGVRETDGHLGEFEFGEEDLPQLEGWSEESDDDPVHPAPEVVREIEEKIQVGRSVGVELSGFENRVADVVTGVVMQTGSQ